MTVPFTEANARLRLLRIILPAGPASLLGQAGLTARMEFVSESGTRITVPYAPLPLDRGNRAREWEELDRGVGRQPLLVEGKIPLKTISFTLTVANLDAQQTIAPILDALDRAAGGRERWSVSYGSTERGLWRFTAYSESITQRNTSHEATRADVQITLTEAGPVAKIGPITGGVSAPPPAAPAKRTYQVKAGDTLSGIAIKFYGDAKKWPQIADANGITDPRKLSTFEQSKKLLIIP